LSLLIACWPGCVTSGCFWGLIPSTESAIKNKKAFVGTHHQFAHNAEMLMAMAFGYPFLNLGAVGLYSSFILLQLGTWLNPIAYVMRTLTGNGTAYMDA